jgi:hypothetical protein
MKKPDEQAGGAAPLGGAAELEALFRRARDDGFTRLETGEVWARLSLAMGVSLAGTPSSTTAGCATSVTAGGFAAKSVAVLLLGAGAAIVGGGLAARSIVGHALGYGTPAGYSAPAATQESPERDSKLSVLSPRDPDVPSVGESPTAPAMPVTMAALDRVRHPEPSKSRTAAGRPSPTSSEVTDPNAKTSHDDTMPSPAPYAGGMVESKESIHSALAGDPGLNEGALLLMARRELASNPSGALELTQQHAKLFANGALVPEREVLAIEALLQLGRPQEARTQFEAFRTRFPQSPHVARVQALFAR